MKTFKNISVKNQTVANAFYSTLRTNLERKEFIETYDNEPFKDKWGYNPNRTDFLLSLQTFDEVSYCDVDLIHFYQMAKGLWNSFIKNNPDKEYEVIELANRTDLSEPVYRVIYNEYGEDAASYVEFVHFEVMFKFQNFVAARLAETQTYINRDTNVREWYTKAYPCLDPNGANCIDKDVTFGYVFDHDDEDDPEYYNLRNNLLDDMDIRGRIRYKMYVSREALKNK